MTIVSVSVSDEFSASVNEDYYAEAWVLVRSVCICMMKNNVVGR